MQITTNNLQKWLSYRKIRYTVTECFCWLSDFSQKHQIDLVAALQGFGVRDANDKASVCAKSDDICCWCLVVHKPRESTSYKCQRIYWSVVENEAYFADRSSHTDTRTSHEKRLKDKGCRWSNQRSTRKQQTHTTLSKWKLVMTARRRAANNNADALYIG